MTNCPSCDETIYLKFQHGLWLMFDEMCHFNLHECYVEDV
jgi:hypothetical protein